MTAVVPPAPTTEAPTPFATGPDTPAGRYLRRFWQPVRLSADLPARQARPITVLGETFTLYRGAGGRAVVTQAGCAHRQTLLSVGHVEGDSIRCMFHGWRFGPDGRCEEAPGQTTRLVERTRIRTYPTHEEHGVVFAYLGDGEPPAFPDVFGFSRAHGRDMASAAVQDSATYRRNCNYFVNVENALDLAHVPYTHQVSSDPTITEIGFSPDVAVVRDVTVERFDFGVRTTEKRDGGVPTVSTVMLPNAVHLIVGQRDGVLEQVAWRVPIDDGSHLSFQITALHTDAEGRRRYEDYQARRQELLARYPSSELCAEQVLRGERTVLDFADHPDLVNIEDHVAQMGMQFIADPGKENLGQSDKAVVALRRMVMSALADVVAGEPTPTEQW